MHHICYKYNTPWNRELKQSKRISPFSSGYSSTSDVSKVEEDRCRRRQSPASVDSRTSRKSRRSSLSSTSRRRRSNDAVCFDVSERQRSPAICAGPVSQAQASVADQEDSEAKLVRARKTYQLFEGDADQLNLCSLERIYLGWSFDVRSGICANC